MWFVNENLNFFYFKLFSVHILKTVSDISAWQGESEAFAALIGCLAEVTAENNIFHSPDVATSPHNGKKLAIQDEVEKIRLQQTRK